MSWITERIAKIQETFNGFFAIDKEVPVPVVAVQAQPDFSSFKVTELKAMAKERGFTGYSNLRKAQLVKLLEEN